MPAISPPSPLPPIYGDGSDGDVTINSNTSLTREMNYRRLVVESGATLYTDGCPVRASVSIVNRGSIRADGNPAINGTAGTNTTVVLLGYGSAGSDGTLGFAASDGTGNGFSWAGSGGAGGTTGAFSGGAGGIATPPAAYWSTPGSPMMALNGYVVGNLGSLLAAGGGGGGGGGSSNGINAHGGGGGGGGGVLYLGSPSIVNAGTISAKGGNGADAYAAGNGGGSGSGGGGGGGGLVILTTSSYSGSAPIVSGGAGGAAYNAFGNAGSAGSAGRVLRFPS